MTARNDVTGQLIKTGAGSNQYKDNWDRIFGAKKAAEQATIDKVTDKIEDAVSAKALVANDLGHKPSEHDIVFDVGCDVEDDSR